MKKGFTLVELLAVIVILAIIALVTTPAILNVITDSRKSGAEDKAWGVMKSVEYAYSEAQYKGQSIPLPYTHDFKNTGSNAFTVNVKGEKPTEGTVTISATGQLSSVGLKFEKNGTYYCSSNTSGTKMCCSSSSKTNAECDTESSSSGSSSGGGSSGGNSSGGSSGGNSGGDSSEGPNGSSSNLTTVYTYHTAWKTIGTSTITDGVANYTDLTSYKAGKTWFFKYEIDSNNVIQKGYVCQKFSSLGSLICLQGGSSSYYADNVNNILTPLSQNSAFTSAGGSCSIGEEYSYCINGNKYVFAYAVGSVNASDIGTSTNCYVSRDGYMYCDK